MRGYRMDIPEQKSRHGSPTFYSLLEEMADTHDAKSHDYASDKNPSGNYHFAGQMAAMFAHSPEDAGFVGRLAEKIYRLANLESGQKTPRNESIADTEKDIAVITALWMADRRDRRRNPNPLEHEMLDLIRLMPDFQVDKLLMFIHELRQTRAANAQMGQVNQHLGASLGIGLQGPQRR